MHFVALAKKCCYSVFSHFNERFEWHNLTPVQKITTVLLQSTANTLITYPQKVTGTLQQYNSRKVPGVMLHLNSVFSSNTPPQ